MSLGIPIITAWSFLLPFAIESVYKMIKRENNTLQAYNPEGGGV